MRWLLATAMLLLAGCQNSVPRAELDISHPLTGRIWSVADKQFVNYGDLINRASSSDFVLLGEKHDNPDHHLHQAAILRSLVDAGHRPTVAFEMLTWDQQAAVDAFIKSQPMDASGMGSAVGWQKSGWPSWSMYLPIADYALAGGLPIVAANFPRSFSRKLARQGFDALPADLLARSKLDVPLSKAQSKQLEEDIFQSHCQMMPRKHLGPVVKVQQARDAVLADALVQANLNNAGAVLIAGSGHVRTDRAVPRYLKLGRPDAKVLALAFQEVQTSATSPKDYTGPYGGNFPFDFVWFTARIEDIDPCEKFKAQLQKMKKKS
jgi:uncharacterized iron-regulated protein